MSSPKPPQPVKFIVSILAGEHDLAEKVCKKLISRFGQIDFMSEALPFNFTDYYEKEIGKALFRYLVSFKTLISPDRLPPIKLYTNEIEDIKVRMGDVESVVEKGVGGITRLTKKLDEKKITPESGDTANNLESELKNAEVQIDESSEETVAEPEIAELIPETPAEETIDTTSETEVEPEVTEPNPETPTEVTEPIPETPTEVEPEAQIIEPGNISSISMETSPISGDLSDDDLDILLSKSLESLLAEQNIDYLINDFLLSLK